MIKWNDIGDAVWASLSETVHTPIQIWVTITIFVTIGYVLGAAAIYIGQARLRRLKAENSVQLKVSIDENTIEVDKIWLTTDTRNRADIDLPAYTNLLMQGVKDRKKLAKPLLVELRPRKNPKEPTDPNVRRKGLQFDQIGMSSALYSKLFPGETVPDNTEDETSEMTFILQKQPPQTGFDLYWNNIDPQTRFQNRLTLRLTGFGILLGIVSLLPVALQFAQSMRLADSFGRPTEQASSNEKPSLPELAKSWFRSEKSP